jgi:hypothetical protein
LASSRWAEVRVLTVARVPTGINLGVSTIPWGVENTPTLALVLLHLAWSWKEKLPMSVEEVREVRGGKGIVERE